MTEEERLYNVGNEIAEHTLHNAVLESHLADVNEKLNKTLDGDEVWRLSMERVALTNRIYKNDKALEDLTRSIRHNSDK